jgi:hypothetical protein
LLSPKVWINLVPVKSSITVVVITIVFGDRRNPNGIETHTLNVVELVLDALEGTSTVLVKVWARSSATICPPEAVSNNLIDSSLLPFVLAVRSSIGG